MTDKELKKIIRDAEKVFAPQNEKSKGLDIKITKETRKLGKKFNKYRELSGKRRLSRSEKYALLTYTPKQVLKAQNLTEKQLARREKAYKKIMGDNVSRETLDELKYLTPVALAKKYGYIPEKKEKKGKETEKPQTYEEKFPDVFSPVQLPTIRWWQIPPEIRRRASAHKKGGFLYENAEILWASPEKISLSRLLKTGTDAGDFRILEFLRITLPSIDNGIFVDPMNEGKLFFVRADEWDKVDELPEDYAETRRYRKKRE